MNIRNQGSCHRERPTHCLLPVRALDIYFPIAVQHFLVPGTVTGAGMRWWAEQTKVLPFMTHPHAPGDRQETNKKAKYRSDGGKCSGEFNREGGRGGPGRGAASCPGEAREGRPQWEEHKGSEGKSHTDNWGRALRGRRNRNVLRAFKEVQGGQCSWSWGRLGRQQGPD